ncbi:hypothetical protein [Nitrosomonas aestuarii]|nr:hypothetical protein [Nitrosomonas aestuarii]
MKNSVIESIAPYLPLIVIHAVSGQLAIACVVVLSIKVLLC